MVGVLRVLHELRLQEPVDEGGRIAVLAPAGGGVRKLWPIQRCLECVQRTAEWNETEVEYEVRNYKKGPAGGEIHYLRPIQRRLEGVRRAAKN